MKILAVIEDLRYKQSSGGIVNYNLINALANDNNTIDIITLDSAPAEIATTWKHGSVTFLPQWPLKFTDNFLKKYFKLKAIYSYFTGLPLDYYRRKQGWQKEIKKHLSANTYDCIFAMGAGDCFNTHHAITNSNIPAGTKTVGLIHDPYPHSHYPQPYNTPKHFVSNILAKHLQKFITKADFLVFPSLRLQQWLEQFYTNIAPKAKIVPHVSGYKNFSNPADIDFDAFEIKKNQFSLMHSGSLLSGRDPLPLIKAAENLITKYSNAATELNLIFLGGVGYEHNAVIEKYSKLPYINFYTKRLNYPTSLHFQRQVFANIIIEGNYKDSPFLPGKFTDYVDAGRHIIALSPANSEVARLLESYPYIAQNGDVEKITDILEQLYLIWKSNPESVFTQPDLQYYVSARHVQKLYKDFLQP
jgi:hypothetical protein